MTMEEAMLLNEQDEVDAYEQELEEQGSSVSDEPSEEDEEDSNSDDEDDSQRVNTVQMHFHCNLVFVIIWRIKGSA